MKFAACTVALSCALPGALSAAVRSAPVGAAYLISNELDKNSILSMDISSAGKLSCGHAFTTYGRGDRGQTATGPAGPDALFSQGPIQVNTAKATMALINPGSNTVSMFAIDKQSPSTISMVGGPVSSGGEFPSSIAINADATQACVVNTGALNGIQCFEMDANLGLLPQSNTNRVIGFNQTTPPSGPGGTTGQVIFTEDGKQLVASVKSGAPNTFGYLATWDILSDGSLSAAHTSSPAASGGGTPFSMNTIPGKNAIFVTDPNIGASLYNFGAQPGGVAKSSLITIDGQQAVCWSVYSGKTGNFYAVDSVGAKVTEISVDNKLEPSIVKQYPLKTGSNPTDSTVVSINNKDFMILNSPGDGTIQVLELIAPGRTSLVQTFNSTECAASRGVTISKNTAGMAAYLKST